MKLNPCGTSGRVARITTIRYADAAVRNAALEREMSVRHKGVVTTGEKSQRLTTTTAGDCFCGTASRRELKEQLAAAKLSTTEKNDSGSA